MNAKSDKYDRQKLLRSHRYLRKNLNSDVEEKITMLTLSMMKKIRLKIYRIWFCYRTKHYTPWKLRTQGIMGCLLHVYPALSMEKGCKNHRETLCSSKGKSVYVVGKPCNIYRLRGKPYDIYRLQGKPYDNYRIIPQFVNITGFPHNIHNLSLWGV